MTLAAFKHSLTADGPPSGTSPPIQALWWAAKGDWSKAHEIAQEHDDLACAWVHGYLHRAEGDHGNAAYWYRRAGRPPVTGPLAAEWDAIVSALLTGIPPRPVGNDGRTMA